MTVAPTSGNSPETSSHTAVNKRPSHWCQACGETIVPTQGRVPLWCSIDCAEWELKDARKSGDQLRIYRAYNATRYMRRRVSV